MADDAEYQWEERRWYTKGAPEGKCWSVREMFSYSPDLDRLIPHLQAMAAGLERPYMETYDSPGMLCLEDRDGIFVIGLRPLTDDDKTEAQRRDEQAEKDERALLADLKAKYEQTA